MSSKFPSPHFVNTNGSTKIALEKALMLEPDEPTATVWSHIAATADNYPGTEVPKSFKVSTKNGSFWTHGNATDHMNEAVGTLKKQPGLEQSNPSLFSQFILYDYRKALTEATRGGVRYNRILKSGHWEFMISKKETDELPVVVHALFKGLK